MCNVDAIQSMDPVVVKAETIKSTKTEAKKIEDNQKQPPRREQHHRLFERKLDEKELLNISCEVLATYWEIEPDIFEYLFTHTFLKQLYRKIKNTLEI